MGAPGRTRLVLASGSKARARVLSDAGFQFEVVVSGVDEAVADGSTARRAVTELARRKATAVVAQFPTGLILGCDSLLDADGAVLGKPGSPAEAVANWRRLSGRNAILYTGHCLVDAGSGAAVAETIGTTVRFGRPTEAEVQAYASTGEPLAMAGSFSTEGFGGPFIEGIYGDPTNILGLSLPTLRRLLAKVGVQLTSLWRDA
jgi:septum formation protein